MSAALLRTARQHRAHGESAPIRVAISGLFLAHPHTGTGRYAREAIDHLSHQPDLQVNVVTDRAGATDQNRHLASNGLSSVRTVAAPMPPMRLGSYERKLYWEQVGLRLAAMRLGADVLYSPHFSLPIFTPCTSVISVHDVIPLTEPAYRGTPAARAYFKLVGAAARRAAAVITLSTHAGREIERLLHIPSARIHVVAPGVNEGFDPRPDPVAAQRVRLRYELPQRYLLYLGGADLRKNIGVLLRARAQLQNRDDVPALVVAAAKPKPGQEDLFPDWRALARRLGLGPTVHFIERVAEEDLATVYREATAFCFPSRAEGFGLTPLEAMACGTPVICSDATSLPEAVGDCGILLPPDDVGAWAAAMSRLCADASLQAHLRARGLGRAAAFRWEATGAGIVAVIREVASCES